jgi:multiple antibiotic resistance protein
VLIAADEQLNLAESLGFAQAAGAIFVGLFVLTHPFGNFALFLGLTSHQTPEQQARTAMKTSFACLVIALVSLLFGQAVLSFFGLTIPALQVAGGIIFLSMGMAMVNGGESESAGPADDGADPSVVPLAMPFIMGPGVIVGMIAFGNSSIDSAEGVLGAVLGTVLAVIVVYLVLRASPWLATRLSPSSMVVITRLTGIIVLGIGVLMGSAGLVEVLPGLG